VRNDGKGAAAVDLVRQLLLIHIRHPFKNAQYGKIL
jgi:hypothetical protein